MVMMRNNFLFVFETINEEACKLAEKREEWQRLVFGPPRRSPESQWPLISQVSQIKKSDAIHLLFSLTHWPWKYFIDGDKN